MSLGHGNKISTNGLVFMYDMGNKKSWKGEPTENLHRKGDFLKGGTDPYAVSAWSEASTEGGYLDPFGKKTGVKYSSVGSPLRYGSGENPDIVVGETYTFSFYAKLTPSGFSTLTTATADIADLPGMSFLNDLTYEWKRFSVTSFHDGNPGFRFVDIYINAGGEIMLACPQIEKKDHATPYLSGERTNTTSLQDMTNNNTITINGLTYNPDDTFEFDTGHLSFNSPIVMTNSDFTLELVGNISSFSERVGSFKSYGVGEFSNASLYFTNISVNGVTSSYNLYFGMSLPTATNFMWTFCFYHETKSHEVFINGISGGVRNDISAQIEDSVEFSFSEFGRSLSTRYYKGKAHQVKIYNRALSTNEVKQNFNAVRNRYGL